MFKIGTALLFTSLFATALAQQMNPDPTFGNNGLVLVPFYGTTPDCYISVVRPQPDGRVVAVMLRTDQTPRPLVLRRYLENGSIDPTFGLNGETSLVVTTPGQVPLLETARIRPDGRILVLLRDGGRNLLVQFTANGELDPTFGQGGIKLHASAQTFDTYNLYIDEQGRALVVGAHGPYASITRYLPTGDPDMSWGTNGIASPMAPIFSSAAMDLAPTPEGGYVVVGTQTGTVVTASWIAKLDPWGQPVSTFGTDGYALMDLLPASLGPKREQLRRVVLRADGGIVAVGNISSLSVNLNVILFALTANGQYDTTFGNGGNHQIILPNGLNVPTPEIFLRNDGRVLVAGVQTGPSLSDNRLVFHEFLQDGTPNSGFGAGGTLSYVRPTMAINSSGGLNFLPNGTLLANVDLTHLGQYKLGILRLEQADITTGITTEEGSTAQRFGAYPNPTSGTITLQAEQLHGPAYVRLLDALGRELQHWDLSALNLAQGQPVQLRTDLPDGVYTIRVGLGADSPTARVVLQR